MGHELKLATLFLCLLSVPFAEAAIRYHKWEVKYEYTTPDCFEKLTITVNGQSPGPTIVAEKDDTVVVELKNSLLTENVAIHWHGIHQKGTPWFDGTAGVTQCPIVPGDTFVYKFVVDRPGTYMYHAHYGLQRTNGLYGMIKVSLPPGVSEPYTYDHEKSILLVDWYHKSTDEQATGLNTPTPNFGWVGEPQSLLINGKGWFKCSGLQANVCNATNPACTRSPYVMTMVPGKTYRLRIGSLTSLSALSFEIEGHNLTVVEADGSNVEPFVVKNLFIYSGETYSVLIKADQDPTRNYWIVSNVVGRLPGTPNGLGILNYSPNNPSTSPPTVPPAGSAWNDTESRLAQSQSTKAQKDYITPPPKKSDRVIVLLNTQNTINGYMRWSVSNVSYTLPNTPYLIAVKDKLHHVFNQGSPPNGYDYRHYDIYNPPVNPNATNSNKIYKLRFDSVVDIILQNANTLSNNISNSRSETHPWHLHGHDFWVMGYGKGKFDIHEDPKKYNFVDPILKNTVSVQPYGWTALRFRADNPGVWFFHCHIDYHMFLGMAVVFEEGIEKLGQLPTSIMGCGDAKVSPRT